MHEERDLRIKLLLEQGVSKLRIAEELGIARQTVSRVAARLGYPSQRRQSDGRDWDEIRAFYEAGHNAAETQRQFGFGASTWRAAIARGGITPRSRMARPERPSNA
jgi:DNA invertase Pin-like site-specific DNA recombinase